MMSRTSKIKQKINWFIFIELSAFAAIVWFTCTENGQGASNVFTISFLVLLYEFIKYLVVNTKNLNSIDGYLFLIIGLSFFNVLLSFIDTDKTIGFETLKNYFIFLSTIIFFRLAEGIRINKKMCNIVFIFNIAISLIYLYTKRNNPDSMDLNFSNPNLAGMFVFVTLVYMILAFIFYKKIIMKIICALLAIGDFIIMYETEARNVLLAFVLFAVIVLLTLFKGSVRYSKAFNFIINITPAIFVAVYLTFINKIVESGKLDFLVSEGKSLTSREEIWKGFLGKIDGMWLTGNYAKASGNAHNSHMVLLCSFGIIVLILVTVYVYKIISKISNNITNKFQTYCLAAFFAVIFMGFGEGALYSGGVGIYILCGIFLSLANSDFGEDFLLKRERAENA